jgi:hypothetical protein
MTCPAPFSFHGSKMIQLDTILLLCNLIWSLVYKHSLVKFVVLSCWIVWTAATLNMNREHVGHSIHCILRQISGSRSIEFVCRLYLGQFVSNFGRVGQMPLHFESISITWRINRIVSSHRLLACWALRMQFTVTSYENWRFCNLKWLRPSAFMYMKSIDLRLI